MTEPSNRAAQFFDGYAHDFNAIYGNRNSAFNRVVNRLFRKAMRLRYEKTLQGCRPIEGRSVLDVGCGPGHYGIALARAGASRVLGIDFAPGMVALAQRNALELGVSGACRFVQADVLAYPLEHAWDYAIVMGFMDYVADSEPVILKVTSVTRVRAFFSFPKDGGLLAWQRKLRYRNRCDLYLYTRDKVEALLRRSGISRYTIESADRDFFVTIHCA
jgi:ubiquinone/menaquinone biosynthesis C-methylase UbiE